MMRLALLSPNVALAARVNQATFTYPIGEVTFDTVTTGAVGNVEAGMTVMFGSTAGADDLGRQRVRAISATLLQFGRSSQGFHDGEVDLTDNAYITVLEDFRVWSKAPYIDPDDGTVYKDFDIAYADENENNYPVANAGANVAGTINSGTGVLRVQLPGASNASFTVADGATISSYLWDLPSGVAIVAGYATSDAVIQVDCDPGWHHIRLVVVDSNTTAHVAWVKVYARDPANDDSISHFEITSHRIGQSGQQISLRILADIPASTYPDGTSLMIWEGEPSSPTDRSHMVFSGWHHTDPASVSGQRTAILRDTVLECADVVGKLSILPGFPQSIENVTGTPSNWLEMKNANMDKYIHYLLQWHCNVLDVADFTWSGTGSDYPFVVLGSEAGNIYDQVNKRALAIVPNHLFTCNTLGQLFINVDPMVQEEADRTATVQATLDGDDWLAIRYTHKRPPQSHWLRGEAIIASASQIAAVFCIAPGNVPGQGQTEIPHGEQLAMSQADLNITEGHRYARLNAPESPFTIDLVGRAGIEPADMTWVTLTVDAAYAAQRGLNFTTERGLPLEVNISYEYTRTGMTKSVNLLWERETTGSPAVTYTLPPAPDPPATQPPPSDNSGQDDYGDGFGTFYTMVGSATNKLGRTRNLSASSPAYSDITPAGAGELFDFILDPYNPRQNGYLSTAAGVYKSTDLDLSSPSWSLVATAASIETAMGAGSSFGNAWKIVGSINVQDYVALFHTDTATHSVYCTYTSNGGSSWDISLVGSRSGGNNFFWGGADCVPHLIGGQVALYCLVVDDGAKDARLRKSTDGGATWSTAISFSAPTFNVWASASLHCPYDDNASGNVVYFSLIDVTGSTWLYRHYRTTDGANETLLENDSLAYPSGIVSRRYAMETYTRDRQQVLWMNSAPNPTEVQLSDDAGDTFTQKSGTGLSGRVYASGGFPVVGSQFYAVSASGIFVSTDSGDNWTDKTGDFGTAVGSLNADDGIGRGVVVPMWLTE